MGCRQGRDHPLEGPARQCRLFAVRGPTDQGMADHRGEPRPRRGRGRQAQCGARLGPLPAVRLARLRQAAGPDGAGAAVDVSLRPQAAVLGRNLVSRRLKVSAAQLGPIHRADSRKTVVARLVEMLKEADSRGSKFVVFPELALTTFFPRWWMEDQAEVDKYFEAQMPSPETLPLFELARSKGIGFYLGYAELTEEAGKTRRFNTSILVGPDGRIVGKYRKVHLPGYAEHRPAAPYQHLEKKYFEVGDLGFNVWKMFKDDLIVGQCICNDRRWPETFRVM